MHVALQRLCRSVTENTKDYFSILHFASSAAPFMFNRLCPFALRPAFPASLTGRYSCDYYGHSVAIELAFLRTIPRSSVLYVSSVT